MIILTARVVRRSFIPNRILVRVDASQQQALTELIPLVEDKKPIGGKPTAFVCRRNVCELPTSDPTVLAKQLAAVVPLKEKLAPLPQRR